MTQSGQTQRGGKMVKEQCIDLPGEKVQCWIGAGTEKFKVILRKHRDVIFDIHTGTGKTYTLEATESDFYNVRDKKIVLAARHGKVTFTDGEKMHIWISRGFRGSLVVKSEGRVMSRVIPNELDSYQYGVSPKEKPAPIIVAIEGHTPTSVKSSDNLQPGTTLKSAATVPLVTPRPSATLVQELDCPVVCVVDGTVKGMPDDLVEYFKKGGDNSGFADIDPNHVATRNWIWGQVAGTGAYAKDNWEWLRASMGKTSSGFRIVEAKVRFVRGKVRFYFSGYSNSNMVFGRGGFGPGNERIMSIFSGAGKSTSTFAATAKGVAGTFKGNALVSFIFGSATAIAEWKADNQKDGYDLAASLITATVKAIVVAAAVSVAVSAFVSFFMVLLGIGVSVIVIGVITIIAGFSLNYVIEAADKSAGLAITHNSSNTDEVASAVAPAIREAGRVVESSWDYLMSKMSGDYREIRFDNAM